MTDLQKWILSIGGAVLGQVAVMVLFGLIVYSKSVPARLVATSSAPSEVTVMLSQLVEPQRLSQELAEDLDEASATVPEPPPQEEEEEKFFERSFVDTENITAREIAPENAKYESDRNTTASTAILPNQNAPQVDGPTLNGDEEVRSLSLTNQEYVAGELDRDKAPPPSDQAQAAAPVAPPTPAEEKPVEEIKDTAPSETEEKPTEQDSIAEQLSEGEAEELKPGEADTPPESEVADQAIEPDAPELSDLAQTQTATQSFTDTSDSHAALRPPSEVGKADQAAQARRVTEIKGRPVSPQLKQEIKATPVESGQARDRVKQLQIARQQQAEAIRQQMDRSMFDSSFYNQRRQNIQNGNINNLGEGSVNAESTEVGKYKSAVKKAIGHKWHQYRHTADVNVGYLRIGFVVTHNGNVQNVRLLIKECSELVAEFSLRAIVDAELPAMPADVRNQLGSSGLEMVYNITIY